MLIAENSSTDVLAASLIFSGEAENSPVTWQNATSMTGLEKFGILSSESVEIYDIWCDVLKILGDPLEESK